MYSYSFRNNRKINKKNLVKKIVNLYNLDLIDNTKNNIIMGNNDIMIDINKKYTFVMLFNDNFNITGLTNYILGTTNESKITKNN